MKTEIEIGMSCFGKNLKVRIEKSVLIEDYKHYILTQQIRNEKAISIRSKLKLYMLENFKKIVNNENSHLYIRY